MYVQVCVLPLQLRGTIVLVQLCCTVVRQRFRNPDMDSADMWTWQTGECIHEKDCWRFMQHERASECGMEGSRRVQLGSTFKSRAICLSLLFTIRFWEISASMRLFGVLPLLVLESHLMRIGNKKRGEQMARMEPHSHHDTPASSSSSPVRFCGFHLGAIFGDCRWNTDGRKPSSEAGNRFGIWYSYPARATTTCPNN